MRGVTTYNKACEESPQLGSEWVTEHVQMTVGKSNQGGALWQKERNVQKEGGVFKRALCICEQ